MSLSVTKVLPFRHPTLESIPNNEYNVGLDTDFPLLGGLLQDTNHVWHAKGPSLEVRNTKTGCKVGAWTFGCILKDSNTQIICIEEIRRPHGRLSLLAVGIDCTISGGLVCIFDVFSCKVIRAIQIKEKISNLHVIDPGIEDLNLPGPLRNFDGILAVGTDGGSVILIDICRQICEEALLSTARKDELNPCQLVLLTSKHIPKIEYYKERSVRDGNHLAIHLNAVLDAKTEHFILKGPKGDDRIYVNREEVATSGLCYCPQLTSLLVGYNFGAFQLWDLTSLTLVYTSPVCDEHLPVTRFALQEPADDPRAFCYVWVSFSKTELDRTGLPFAVMYSLCYESKEYHEGYGFLYQDFQHCSVRFQVELGSSEEIMSPAPTWGCCLSLQPITKLPAGKEPNSRFTSGDTLALCLISWSVWFDQQTSQTYALIFDLNQWYKEQMPNFTKWKNCTNYLLRLAVSDPIHMAGHKSASILDVALHTKSLRQFVGVQRLEEHFYPTSLSFDVLALRENDVVSLHNESLQQALLFQVESTGPLCLIRPSDVSRQVLSLGLTPLFSDESLNSSFSAATQREIILNVGLEHQLVGWLCKCASEWASGSFASAGCSLDFLLSWAFQRAVVLKTNCDKYCAPLFDHSQSQLDDNTANLLSSCIRQVNNLCTLYSYVVRKLASFLPQPDIVEEQRRSLQMVSVYFEVLQWLVNVGLLPEYAPGMRPRNSDRIGAPYPVQELTKFYSDKRTELQLLNEEIFASKDSLLFVDNLIQYNCGGDHLQRQWREDKGSGMYPPPSLQSLIRTYLVEVSEIKHKHSLVIYLFLDLAMALEKSQYAPVITYLIKFPAVFKVSTSVIKITQAFWQLDHGDFATAMEQLLDPFVLGEDLQPWQHTLAMRSLCVQKQYNFALLYIQTRRPPMTDQTDFLTAISLFVANKMLDEAFYFMKQHRNGCDEKLLMHLFEECRKNNCLHDLLYKNLGSDEEQAFIKYLKNVNSANSDELQVFYYLLRSRYVEAFDFYDGVVKVNDRQGLIGRSNVSITDQVVRIFKSLLPDVNRNLVEYIRKERTNLWKEVSKPTPLSVFVHNTDEQIQYKSTLIHAALAKAKHTFQDNFNDTRFNGLLTEETPFLRTPKAFKNDTRIPTNVITPTVIELDENGEGIGPSPPKKLKLSPRVSTGSPPKMNVSVHSIMLTPIVRRKTSFQQDHSTPSNSFMNVCTPQSILKGRNIEDFEDTMRTNRLSGIGLQSRRSLSRTPRPQHVQFQDSFSDQSSKPAESTSLEDQILHKSSLSSKDISCMVSSKESSRSTNEDTFYSPNTSLEEVSHEKEQKDDTNVDEAMTDEYPVRQEIEKWPGPNESSLESPRGRRSCKRSFKEMSPVRSSPRLAKNVEVQTILSLSKKDDSVSEGPETVEISTSNTSFSTESLSPMPSPRIFSKVKGRRSLSRQVLEQNTFLKLCDPASKNTSVTKESSFSKTEKIVSVEKSPRTSRVTTVETKLKICDTSRTALNNSSDQKSHDVSGSITKKKVFESSMDCDTSGSDYSFGLSDKESELEISDSVNEYMKSVYSRLGRSPKDEFSNDPGKYGASVRTTNIDPVATEGSQVQVSRSGNNVEGIPEVTPKKSPLVGSATRRDDATNSFSSKELETESWENVTKYQTCSKSKADVQSKNEDSISAGPKNIEISTSKGSISTESSPIPSPRLPSKVKARRSLSRQVLEQNTFLKLCEPIQQNTSISSTSRSTPTTSVQKSREIFEKTAMDCDTSASDYSFGLSDKESELEISDSVNEYMKSVYSKIARMKNDNSSDPGYVDLVEEKGPSLDESASRKDDVTNSSDKELEPQSLESVGEYQTYSKSEANEHSEKDVQLDQRVAEEDIHSENKDKCEEVISMEVYEDLSSGADDKESSAEDPSMYNELELNVFEVTGSSNATHSKTERGSASSSSRGSESSSVPETEKAFIEFTPRKDTEEAILISSSEDEDKNKEANSDGGGSSVNLQVSFEQNIQAARNNESDESEESEEELDEDKDRLENREECQDVRGSSGDEENTRGEAVQVMKASGDTGVQEISDDSCEKDAPSASVEKASTTNVTCLEPGQELEELMVSVPQEPEVVEADSNSDVHLSKQVETEPTTISNVTVDQRTEGEKRNDYKHESSSPALKETNVKSKKKDQSTNTTFATVNTTTLPKIQNDVEISVRENMDTSTDKSSQTLQESVTEQTFVGDLNWKQNQRVYGTQSAKINVEDSSSDTTEGETVNREIVVTAQIHTPVNKQTEEPPIKRVTRRSMSLMSQSLSSDTAITVVDVMDRTPKVDAERQEMSDMSLVGADDVFMQEKSRSTPRITRRLSQCSTTAIDCEPATSKETIKTPKVEKLVRRTRSASVDEVKTYSRKRTLSRSSSVDEDGTTEQSKSTKGKARSVVQMPVISEEAKTKRTDKESYASSRRLTRRQASIVKDVPTPTDITAEDDSGSEKQIELDDFDPIKLLDKEPFQGEPDPEEKKVYEVSPSPSNSTTSSLQKQPARRTSRSASVASDISLPPSASQPPTPEKRPRQTRSQTVSPKASTGVKTRSRKQSETSSVVSEKSDPATPPKRPRQKQSDGSEGNTTIKRTRSRAESVSSVNSDTVDSPRKNLRSRRLVSAKSDLPEITEEKVTESKPSPKKNTRKKK